MHGSWTRLRTASAPRFASRGQNGRAGARFLELGCLGDARAEATQDSLEANHVPSVELPRSWKQESFSIAAIGGSRYGGGIAGPYCTCARGEGEEVAENEEECAGMGHGEAWLAELIPLPERICACPVGPRYPPP